MRAYYISFGVVDAIVIPETMQVVPVDAATVRRFLGNAPQVAGWTATAPAGAILAYRDDDEAPVIVAPNRWAQRMAGLGVGQYSGWTIRTGFTTGMLLAAHDLTGVDIAASIQRYQELLREAISAEFPGATLLVQEGDMSTMIVPPNPVDDLSKDIEFVEDIRQQLVTYHEGWLVHA